MSQNEHNFSELLYCAGAPIGKKRKDQHRQAEKRWTEKRRGRLKSFAPCVFRLSPLFCFVNQMGSFIEKSSRFPFGDWDGGGGKGRRADLGRRCRGEHTGWRKSSKIGKFLVKIFGENKSTSLSHIFHTFLTNSEKHSHNVHTKFQEIPSLSPRTLACRPNSLTRLFESSPGSCRSTERKRISLRQPIADSCHETSMRCWLALCR